LAVSLTSSRGLRSASPRIRDFERTAPFAFRKPARRLATLAAFAREVEAILTGAALAMSAKLLGSVFRRADRAYKDNMVDRVVGPFWQAAITVWLAAIFWKPDSA
jgi:hypothetical protein